ncbi:MAG: helix-turn-helix transcriptional regulator, partial [Phycicoccus sp.]
LLSLLQSPRDWPGSELATRLGVTGRTVRRDVERLRSLGYPVEATLGHHGGYRLVAGSALPPLLLEDDEAVAVAVGLQACAGQAVAGIDEASLRALTKLTRVLPSRLRHRVRSLSASTTVLPPGSGPQVDADDLTVLAAAVANHERLRMHYVARDGSRQRRHVEPVRLVVAGRRWYLLAFDLDRDDWRTFRVDRIDDPRPTGGRSGHREAPGGSVERYVSQARLEMAPTYRADVTLGLPQARARIQLADQLAGSTLEAEGEDRCRWISSPDTLPWLTLRILRLECSFDVHGPPELVEHLRDVAQRVGSSLPTGTPRQVDTIAGRRRSALAR